MVLDAILPVVTRCSSLSLRLYQVAAASQEAAKQLIDTAKVTNSFALNLKQVGTIITENDQLPSHVALESLENIISQARSVLGAIESSLVNGDGVFENAQSDHVSVRKLSQAGIEYLTAHLEALRSTLSLLLQTLFTAQSIMWSKCRPTISPQQGAKTVRNERLQLEAFIVDQQMSMLCASKAFEGTTRPESRLLMETDSSMSLVSSRHREGPSPADLHRYQDRHLASLDIDQSDEAAWLPAVSGIKSTQADRLLQLWTSLPQFENRLKEEERDAQKQRHETLQPTVESDSDDDQERNTYSNGDSIEKRRRRSGSVQPLFADPNAEEYYGPAAPPSPVATPRQSRNNSNAVPYEQASPVTPRSSIGSLPVEAAAAIEAKEEDDDIDLEIPWTLCTRKYYWKYIDAKQVSSNTDQNPSIAFLERNSWTEIMASWVCKEAIQEMGLECTQVQKDRRDGRRTRWETCFCIKKPLQFDQVKKLVERTVELYRKHAPPTPPPSHARSSYQRPPPLNLPKSNILTDRSRTPVPRNTHPPLDRPKNSSTLPPPPPLDRSLSMPGPEYFPPPYPPPKHQAGQIPRSANLQIPTSQGQYTAQPLPRPQSPRLQQHPQQSGGYPTQPTYPQSPQFAYPPNGHFSSSLPQNIPPYPFVVPQSPLRPPYMNPQVNSRYDDRDLGTSDSDSTGKERSRKHRSKSRTRHATDKKRKSHKTSKALGALMGVGGLTALLDGLSAV